MNLLIFIFITLSIISLGKIIVKHLIKFDTEDWFENLLLYFGLGAGVLSFFIYFLGIIFLNKIFFLFIIVLLTVYGITCIDLRIFKEIYNSFSKLSKVYKLIWVVFCGCILANLLSSYIPALQSDALQYHLLIPKYYLSEGRIFDLTGIVRYSVFPQLMEMQFLIGMLLKSDIVARLIHTGFGIFAALTVFAIGRKYFNYKVATLGMLIFYLSPVVRHLSGTAMIDLCLTFYFLISGYTLIRWIEKQDKKWLILYAIFCGCSFSIKYTGVLALMWLPLGIIFRELINKEFKLKGIIVKFIFPALLYILIISPWLIRNYIYTGNPVSPFFYNIFSGSNWNSYLESNWKSHLAGGIRSSGIKEYISRKLDFLIKIFEHTPLNIPALFIVFLKCRKENPKAVFLFFTAIFYIIAGVIMTPRIYRFFLPALAVTSIVSAYVFYKIMDLNASRYSKIFRIIVLLFIIIGVTNRVYETLASTGKNWQVITGLTTKDDFLMKKLDCYGIAEYININLKSNDRILSLNETRGYYYNCTFIVSHEVVSGSVAHTSRDINEIMNFLNEGKIKYVLINKSEYFQAHQRPTILLEDKNLDKYFELVATRGKCFLYKIKINA